MPYPGFTDIPADQFDVCNQFEQAANQVYSNLSAISNGVNYNIAQYQNAIKKRIKQLNGMIAGSEGGAETPFVLQPDNPLDQTNVQVPLGTVVQAVPVQPQPATLPLPVGGTITVGGGGQGGNLPPPTTNGGGSTGTLTMTGGDGGSVTVDTGSSTLCFQSPPPECPPGWYPVWDPTNCRWFCQCESVDGHCDTTPPPPPPPPPDCYRIKPACPSGQHVVYDMIRQCWYCEPDGSGGGDCGSSGPEGDVSKCCPKSGVVGKECHDLLLSIEAPWYGYGCCVGNEPCTGDILPPTLGDLGTTGIGIGGVLGIPVSGCVQARIRVCCIQSWDTPAVPFGVTLFGPMSNCTQVESAVTDWIKSMSPCFGAKPPPPQCTTKTPKPKCGDCEVAEWDDINCRWNCVKLQYDPGCQECVQDCHGDWVVQDKKCKEGYTLERDENGCGCECVKTQPDGDEWGDDSLDWDTAAMDGICGVSLDASQCQV